MTLLGAMKSGGVFFNLFFIFLSENAVAVSRKSKALINHMPIIVSRIPHMAYGYI